MNTKSAFRTLCGTAAAGALALGFAAAPLSLAMDNGSLSLVTTKAFARQGADDPIGHIRHGRGADDAAGHVRGGHGADDPAGHVSGGHGADDSASRSSAAGNAADDHGGDRGGKGRGRGGDDGKGHN